MADRWVDGKARTLGDIIRAIDRTPLQSSSQFQAIVRDVRSGDPVVLQIERSGTLQYLAFEMD
jgi:hypothetical protein